jgi:hypothetical protein
MTLQEYANTRFLDSLRQPLKTIEEALAVVGWEVVDKPTCCGSEVEIRGMLGVADHGECKRCGRFVHSIDAPEFSEHGSACYFLDREKFSPETDWNRIWIAGQRTADGVKLIGAAR